MPAKPSKDILPVFRILTAEKLDIVRLKLWKQFGEVLRTIKSGRDPDDLLRETVVELVKGKKTCPGKRIDPPTCLSSLVERRVNALSKRLTIPKQPPLPDIDALPIEKIREELWALGTEIELFHAKIAHILGMPKLLSEYWKKRILEIFWIPIGAGRPRTSSPTSKQEHSFITEEGMVKIWCRWAERHNDEPTYLWLSWEAHITTEKELWILFLDPGTQGIRYEVNLGTYLTGETTFTSDELGFDPSHEDWAISLMLQEAG